jgi:hypothetical protein
MVLSGCWWNNLIGICLNCEKETVLEYVRTGEIIEVSAEFFTCTECG